VARERTDEPRAWPDLVADGRLGAAHLFDGGPVTALSQRTQTDPPEPAERAGKREEETTAEGRGRGGRGTGLFYNIKSSGAHALPTVFRSEPPEKWGMREEERVEGCGGARRGITGAPDLLGGTLNSSARRRASSLWPWKMSS